MNFQGNQVCEICKQKQVLVQHHIRGREIPQANHPSNLANICSNCHVSVHHGDIIIEKKFQTTNGLLLIWHYKHEQSVTNQDAVCFLQKTS